MTDEFKIDRPGVYRMRNGNRVPVWCNAACENMGAKWVSLGHQVGMAWNNSGRRYYTCESENDIVAYVSPLPADILQRMAEALEAAEYCPQQTTPATFGEALKAMTQEQPQ
jgi:hypothetical protein